MEIKTELCPATPEECRAIRNQFREEAPIRDSLGLQECGSFGIKTMGNLITLMVNEDPESKIFLSYVKHRNETFIDLTTLFTDGSFLTTTNSATAGYVPEISGHFLQIFKQAGLENCWNLHKEGIAYLSAEFEKKGRMLEPQEFKEFIYDLNIKISSTTSYLKIILNMISLRHLRYSKPLSEQPIANQAR